MVHNAPYPGKKRGIRNNNSSIGQSLHKLQQQQQQNSTAQKLLVLIPMMVPCTTNFQQPTDFSDELITTQMGTINTGNVDAAPTTPHPNEYEVEQTAEQIAIDAIIDQLELDHIQNEIVNIVNGENLSVLVDFSKQNLQRLYEMALVNLKKDITSLMNNQRVQFEKLFTMVNDK